jgi:hypothetical protein
MASQMSSQGQEGDQVRFGHGQRNSTSPTMLNDQQDFLAAHVPYSQYHANLHIQSPKSLIP